MMSSLLSSVLVGRCWWLVVPASVGDGDDAGRRVHALPPPLPFAAAPPSLGVPPCGQRGLTTPPGRPRPPELSVSPAPPCSPRAPVCVPHPARAPSHWCASPARTRAQPPAPRPASRGSASVRSRWRVGATWTSVFASLSADHGRCPSRPAASPAAPAPRLTTSGAGPAHQWRRTDGGRPPGRRQLSLPPCLARRRRPATRAAHPAPPRQRRAPDLAARWRRSSTPRASQSTGGTTRRRR